jgi:hypothetical protein
MNPPWPTWGPQRKDGDPAAHGADPAVVLLAVALLVVLLVALLVVLPVALSIVLPVALLVVRLVALLVVLLVTIPVVLPVTMPEVLPVGWSSGWLIWLWAELPVVETQTGAAKAEATRFAANKRAKSCIILYMFWM